MGKLEVGDIVLCTVDRIVGTIVFVKIEGNGEGSIITSEIAPGRIRNIRDYVIPKKKIVCKVLRVSGDRIDLSLRRVSQKEKKEVLEAHKQEKSCKSVLKSVLGEEVKKLISDVEKKESVYDFCQRIKENPKELEKTVGKEKAKKILTILKTQKQKKIIIKKEFSLHSNQSNGISLIKDILKDFKDIEIRYLSAGKFSIKTQSENPKSADNKLKKVLISVEKEAKKQGLNFSIGQK
jgi:translation initiation factor 2 alpha subunit (eIF-2alpha)